MAVASVLTDVPLGIASIVVSSGTGAVIYVASSVDNNVSVDV